MAEKPVPRLPVYLDEDDGLLVDVPPTPTDPGFRRGLYVLLIVVGLFAAAGFVDARQNAQVAERRAVVAERDRDHTAQELQALVETVEQRTRRSVLLERLVISLLANSDDPEVREDFEQFARDLGIDPGDPKTIIPRDPPRPNLGSTSRPGGSTVSPRRTTSPRPFTTASTSKPRQTQGPQPEPRPEPEPEPEPSPGPPPIATIPPVGPLPGLTVPGLPLLP